MRRTVFILFLITLATPALADAIDSDWCSVATLLSIKGPEITLPTGAVIKGDCRRHAFMKFLRSFFG